MHPLLQGKIHSPAAERNQAPILAVLRDVFADRRRVLEIGSGTGQHAAAFSLALPHLQWQASDVAAHLPGIQAWLDEAGTANAAPPVALDVDGDWPARRYDAIFSANTLHILSWPQVERLFARLPEVLTDDAVVVFYGPFNVDGQPTSASNAEFDASLRQRAPHMGLRDVDAVDALASKAGLAGLEQRLLPSNNRCLLWRNGRAQSAGVV